MLESWDPQPRTVPLSQRAEGEPPAGGFLFYCAALKFARRELVETYLAACEAYKPGSSETILKTAEEEPKAREFADPLDFAFLGMGPPSQFGIIAGAKHDAWNAVLNDFHGIVRSGVVIECFAYDRAARRREPVPAAWIRSLKFEGLDARNAQLQLGYTEPLFYPTAATEPTAEDGGSEATQRPRDTPPLRKRAAEWLADFVKSGEHRNRDATLDLMRAAHPGLGIRGSIKTWLGFTRTHPDLKLSQKGRKSKRNTNN